MAADPITYCLTHLSDYRDFERLCSALLVDEGFPRLDPLGGKGDGGRDAIVRADSAGRRIIFAYTVRADWEIKLRRDCERVEQLSHEPNVFVFVCTSTLSANDKDRAHDNVYEDFGWELVLFDLERLRVLLAGKHRHLIAMHPGIFPPQFFPPPPDTNALRLARLAAVQLLAVLEPALDHICKFGLAIAFAPWPTFADNEQQAKEIFEPLKPVDFNLVGHLAPFGEEIGIRILDSDRKLAKARHMLGESLPNGGINGVIQRIPWTEERDVEFKALLASSRDDMREAIALLRGVQ